jgi:hypothetical protein
VAKDSQAGPSKRKRGISSGDIPIESPNIVLTLRTRSQGLSIITGEATPILSKRVRKKQVRWEH